MLPPPGLEPSLAALQDATPTTLLLSIIATATSIAAGVDLPTTTTTLAAAAATATSLAFSDHPPGASDHHGPPHGPHGAREGECKLLGPFAILVQGALGCMALLALVFKRWRERPQRPVKIWFFDVSKQVVGSILVHIANLLMSMLSSGQFSIKVDPTIVVHQVVTRMVGEDGKYRPNPCSFYLLNLAIDTTIGIPILIFLLRIFTHLFQLTPFGQPHESIISGNYGSPPKATWWFKQSIIYFLGLLGMKICVLIIFLVLPWISRVGDWALKWTEGDEALQVIFVMLVFPVIMNATQYYIIDSFIKKQVIEGEEHERLPDHDVEEHHQHNGPYDDPEHPGEETLFSEDEDEEVKGKKASADAAATDGKEKLRDKGKVGSGSVRVKRGDALVTHRDYDPLFDGESSPQTTVVGSASGSSRGVPASKEVDSDTEEELKRSDSLSRPGSSRPDSSRRP